MPLHKILHFRLACASDPLLWDENTERIIEQSKRVIAVSFLKSAGYFLSYPIAPAIMTYDLLNYLKTGAPEWSTHFIPASKYIQYDEGYGLVFEGNFQSRWSD